MGAGNLEIILARIVICNFLKKQYKWKKMRKNLVIHGFCYSVFTPLQLLNDMPVSYTHLPGSQGGQCKSDLISAASFCASQPRIFMSLADHSSLFGCLLGLQESAQKQKRKLGRVLMVKRKSTYFLSDAWCIQK